MTREEYILKQSKLLLAYKRQQDKAREKSLGEVSAKKMESLINDMAWAGMHIEQTKERIGYALGLLDINDIRDTYNPSGFHEYRGIKGELSKLEFKD